MLALFASFTSTVLADEPNPSPLPPLIKEDISVQAWGERNPNCTEWTNACQICRRDADGKMNCSLPGIACQPSALVCKVNKKTP